MSETSLPFSQYSPSSGESRQPIRFISVDLPDPDGPMIATYSPFSIDRSTPRSAWISSPPMRYLRFRLCVWMIAFTLQNRLPERAAIGVVSRKDVLGLSQPRTPERIVAGA